MASVLEMLEKQTIG